MQEAKLIFIKPIFPKCLVCLKKRVKKEDLFNIRFCDIHHKTISKINYCFTVFTKYKVLFCNNCHRSSKQVCKSCLVPDHRELSK